MCFLVFFVYVQDMAIPVNSWVPAKEWKITLKPKRHCLEPTPQTSTQNMGFYVVSDYDKYPTKITSKLSYVVT